MKFPLDSTLTMQIFNIVGQLSIPGIYKRFETFQLKIDKN